MRRRPPRSTRTDTLFPYTPLFRIMAPKQISDRLSVSPQLSPADIDAAAVKGFRMIVNNRPDGEAAGQPTSAELAARADAASSEERRVGKECVSTSRSW